MTYSEQSLIYFGTDFAEHQVVIIDSNMLFFFNQILEAVFIIVCKICFSVAFFRV